MFCAKRVLYNALFFDATETARTTIPKHETLTGTYYMFDGQVLPVAFEQSLLGDDWMRDLMT